MSELTKKWLRKTIIELNLCPFARAPFENNNILIQRSKGLDFEQIYDDILLALKKIEQNLCETVILETPLFKASFEDFYHLAEDINDILFDLTLPYQVVAFHPNFRFESLDENNKANFVNRSPIACLHLLSKHDLDKAMSTNEMAKSLSRMNEEKINALSEAQIKEYFFYMRENNEI